MIASLLIVVLVHTTSLVGFTPSPAKCRSIGAIRCRGKHILISLLAFSRHTFFNQAFLEKMPYLSFPDCAEVPSVGRSIARSGRTRGAGHTDRVP